MTRRPIFEQSQADAMGRIGTLAIPRADTTLETPAILPVINPHVQLLDPTEIVAAGADALITNAYILHESDTHTDTVLDDGIHAFLGVDVPVMTDSGSYQLAEYGHITVTTPEILKFQHDIGADIATPVDVPTPPDAHRDEAETDTNTTQDRLETAAAFDTADMLVTGPIQGSTYPDLRETAARAAYNTGLDIYPIGGVVPLLTAYRYADLVDVITACKRGLGRDAPVHLFGAGHPMTFALAVALGCDLFDSAAYSLYARDDRYLTVHGTNRLDTLAYLPCPCPVCLDHTPRELQTLPDPDRHRALARHNLHATFAELNRIKQALRDGTLLDLVDARARAHPALLDGLRATNSHTDQIERDDPVRKRAFFYTSTESAHRPEVHRHHHRLDRLRVPAELNLTTHPETHQPDAVPGTDAAVWAVIPPFGPVPPALLESYPFTAELPATPDTTAQTQAIHGITTLAQANPRTTFTFTYAHDTWPEPLLAALPDHVTPNPR